MRSVLYIGVISVLCATLHGCGPLRSAVGTSYDQQLLEALNAPPGCGAGDQRVRSTVGNAQRFAEAKARTALARSISIEVQNVMKLMTAEGTNVSEENASSESRQETNQALRGVVTKSRQLLVDNDQNKTVVVTVCLEPKNYDAKTPGEALEVMLARTKERLASAADASSVAEPTTRGAGVASAGGSHGSSIDFNKIYSGHHALVIGVDDYHSPGLKDLGGAVRDAKAIGAFLNARGFKVTELLNKQATRKGIKSALRALAKDVKERDRVIVFFAGHGVSDGAGDAKMGYLMPHDADPQLPDDAGIEMDWLQRRLDGMKAKHVMFLADACYSGIAIETRGSAMPVSTPDYVAEITKANVRLTMTAGTDGQEAMEYQGHGLFTYFLLDALKGAADRDRDGFITSLEISQHLATQVPPIAKRKVTAGQTPQTGRMGQGEMVFRAALHTRSSEEFGVAGSKADPLLTDKDYKHHLRNGTKRGFAGEQLHLYAYRELRRDEFRTWQRRIREDPEENRPELKAWLEETEKHKYGNPFASEAYSLLEMGAEQPWKIAKSVAASRGIKGRRALERFIQTNQARPTQRQQVTEARALLTELEPVLITGVPSVEESRGDMVLYLPSGSKRDDVSQKPRSVENRAFIHKNGYAVIATYAYVPRGRLANAGRDGEVQYYPGDRDAAVALQKRLKDRYPKIKLKKLTGNIPTYGGRFEVLLPRE